MGNLAYHWIYTPKYKQLNVQINVADVPGMLVLKLTNGSYIVRGGVVLQFYSSEKVKSIAAGWVDTHGGVVYTMKGTTYLIVETCRCDQAYDTIISEEPSAEDEADYLINKGTIARLNNPVNECIRFNADKLHCVTENNVMSVYADIDESPEWFRNRRILVARVPSDYGEPLIVGK